MSQRRGSRRPSCGFVREQLPGLPAARGADAVPCCRQAWALLTEEEKATYTEKARKWNGKKCSQKTEKAVNAENGTPFSAAKLKEGTCHLVDPVPASLTTRMPSVTSVPDACALSWKNDQAVVADIFYFLDIYSHGKLPAHCEQRFLPCEIGCVRYSLLEGVMADFHHFIEPEVPPRGFLYHCRAAGDETHKIPVFGFNLPCTGYAVVLQELLEFAQPARGVQPRFFCRSNDRFRINWCLCRMASVTGTENHLELFAVEDLLIKLYQKKYQKEPSKAWMCRTLDASLWDYSSNTRCKWHEENDIVCCALASCKKITYCISTSLASVYGVALTAAHLPLEDSDWNQSTSTRIVKLGAGCLQEVKPENSGYDRPFASPSQDREFVPSNCDSPRGVKTSLCETSVVQGRGVTRFLKSAPDLSKSFSI